MAYVSSWICNALERGALEVNLRLMTTNSKLYLPYELFTNQRLVKLTLGTQLSLGKIPPESLH